MYKKVKKREWRHGFFHVMHGLLPWVKYFEGKVGTPDRDHKSAIGRNTNYLAHLVKNFKCARNCLSLK